VTASRYTIEAVSFGPEGVRVAYMTPTDVRAEGTVYQAHTLAVSWENEDLQPLVTAVEDAAGNLLAAAIQAWAGSKPFDVVAARQEALDDDDTDEGLGSP
jgi:hypothetical protein